MKKAIKKIAKTQNGLKGLIKIEGNNITDRFIDRLHSIGNIIQNNGNWLLFDFKKND